MRARQALRRVSLALVPACVVAWPATSLTVFRGEPQGVLALSWVAIVYAAVNTFVTLDVRVAQDEDD